MRVAVFSRRACARRGAGGGDRGGRAHGVDELWSLGDMVGTRPGPGARGRAHARALPRRAARQPRLPRAARRPARIARSIEHRPRARSTRTRSPGCARASRASRRGDDVQMLARRPAQRGARVRRAAERGGVPGAPARAARPRRAHARPRRVPRRDTRRVRITPGEPLDISAGQVAAQPGRGRCAASSRSAGGPGSTSAAALWLLLDLDAQTATWMAAPFDPAAGASERGPRRLGFAL